jgi:hypothetical protein
MRPDATLIAIAAPAGLALLAKDGLRRAALATIGVAFALIGVIVVACWLYYGDPLPLAFISKNPLLTYLPASGYREFLGDPADILLFMGLLHYPEIILCLGALAMLRRLPPAVRGALLGALLFALYHVALVLPIMASYARFYAPATPVLVLGAMFAIEAMVRNSGIARVPRQIDLSGLAMLAGVALLLVCKAYPLVLNTVYAYGQAPALDDGRNSKDGALASAAEQYYFFGGRLTQLVGALGKDCSVSSTEDGLLSAYAKGSRIVDISALHDRTMARDGFSADRVLLRQRPDVLIMPHPHYVDWAQALLNHPAMTRDYELVPPVADKSAAIAFRRDSACAQRVRRAVYGG